MTLPSLFVSHGAPTLPLERDSPARGFLAGLGRALDRPEAILCVSAHWEAPAPSLGLAARPETIHDFYGFPDALYRLRYPAPGAPDLARRAAALLEAAGLEPALEPARGLDHGAWVPLLLMFPEADIPVTQLSLLARAGAAAHLALGRALAPLRAAGVLVLASGGAVHNLRHWRAGHDEPPDWARDFDDWLAERITAGAVEELVGYRELAPAAATAHPSEEHLLPLHVALGAAEGPGRVLHSSFTNSLSMAAFAFDGV